jgi:hypothetical protein
VSRRAFYRGLLAASCALILLGTLGGAPADATAVPGLRAVLLPVPRAGAGTALSTSVVAVTPLGAMAGTTSSLRTLPDGSSVGDSTVQRWLPAGPRGWIRQQLPRPAGTTDAQAAGLTDLAEVGGSWDTDGVQEDDVAVRWPLTGTAGTVIGDIDSRVTAVGPDGPWGVQTDVPGYRTIAATVELVARDGTRTPIGTGSRYTSITSIADQHTVLLNLIDGVGYGTTSTPAVWRDGQLQRLPVFSSVFGPPDCVSRILPDGTVAYSGITDVAGSIQEVAQVHRGGVPGTEEPLDLRGGTGSVACGGPDTVASDGSVGGTLELPGQSAAQATIWPGTEPAQLPLQPGETSSTVVALQSAAYAVVRGQLSSGGHDLWAWHDGRVIPLAIPSGYTLGNVVTLTPLGLVVANLRDTLGLSRPAAWQIP